MKYTGLGPARNIRAAFPVLMFRNLRILISDMTTVNTC